MFQKRIKLVAKADFEAVREDITEGVVGFPLVPGLSAQTKITLTQVEPKGEFSEHRDEYHHVLYFISGNGVGWLDKEVTVTLMSTGSALVQGAKDEGDALFIYKQVLTQASDSDDTDEWT